MLKFVYDALQQSKGDVKMHAQRKPATARSTRSKPAPRPEYTAAIRYLDGSRDLFHVRNADDMDDARALVIAEVGEVRSLVIALRQ
jgi:hypothetical protein